MVWCVWCGVVWCGVVWYQDPSQEVSSQQEVPRQAGLVSWYVGWWVGTWVTKTPLKGSQGNMGWCVVVPRPLPKGLKTQWVGTQKVSRQHGLVSNPLSTGLKATWVDMVWYKGPSQEVSRQPEVRRQARLVGWYMGYQDPSQGVSRQRGLVCCGTKTPLKGSLGIMNRYQYHQISNMSPKWQTCRARPVP